MARKAKWVLLLVLAAVGVMWLVGSRVRAAADEEPQNGDRVAELEARVETLEAEIEGLKRQLQTVLPGGPRVLSYAELPAPPNSSRAPSLPAREPSGVINGVPYYVIPLDGSESRQ